MYQPQDDPTTGSDRAPGTPLARRRVLIVATGRDRGALAAARAFRRAGWYVGVGTPEGGGSLGASAACGITFQVPRPRDGSSSFIDGVRGAAEAGSFDVVFGGGDDWMAALAAYRAQIPIPVAHPDFDIVETVLDKIRVPRDWPREDGPFDLIVLSETGYFLSSDQLDEVIRLIGASLDDDGVLVLCHWRHPIEGWELDGDTVHQCVREQSGLTTLSLHTEEDFLLEILVPAPAVSVARREGLV